MPECLKKLDWKGCQSIRQKYIAGKTLLPKITKTHRHTQTHTDAANIIKSFTLQYIAIDVRIVFTIKYSKDGNGNQYADSFDKDRKVPSMDRSGLCIA